MVRNGQQDDRGDPDRTGDNAQRGSSRVEDGRVESALDLLACAVVSRRYRTSMAGAARRKPPAMACAGWRLDVIEGEYIQPLTIAAWPVSDRKKS